jgi:hypothetical protein
VTALSEPVSIAWTSRNWRGETRVLADNPDLVIIHRSSFFHPVNGAFGLGPPFMSTEMEQNWRILYEMCDSTLVSFLGNLGAKSSRTKFLVYSRLGDGNWTNQNFRAQWTRDIEERFPSLKGRVFTLWVQDRQDGKAGSFRDPTTAHEMRATVKSLLKVSEKDK